MSHSRPPKLRPDCQWLAIVGDVVAGPAPARDAALAIVRREVGDYVECFATLPIPAIHDTEPARRTIAQRVLQRVEADTCSLLREWRHRALRRRDHAAFWTMVNTVVWYVSIEYADRLDAAARSSTDTEPLE